MLIQIFSLLVPIAVVTAQVGDAGQVLLTEDLPFETFASKYGQQVDLPFTGPLSFAHLPYARCLSSFPETPDFDIGIIGMPFDTAVSYRPGARFGPFGIRAGSRRIRAGRGWTLHWKTNPYVEGGILDCGDIPLAISDNALAIDQMDVAYSTLLARQVKSANVTKTAFMAKDGREHPRIVSLGGDHTIVLPILRSLHRVYGDITVIHFDSHLDTWTPLQYPGTANDENSISAITHGSFFWKAWREGLMSRRNVHAGIRCKFQDMGDIEHDEEVGFALITTDDIDVLGPKRIVDMIRDRVGDSPVYLSVDIDVIDPAYAPATGTPEAGGWTTREFKSILRGLAGLNLVGADIVEVAPAYDTNAETTSVIAADIVHEFISLFMADGPMKEETPMDRGWGRTRAETPERRKDEL